MAADRNVPEQTLRATPKLGPLTVACRFEAFSVNTVDALSQRLSPYACEETHHVEARIHGAGVHPFLYSDTVIADDLGHHAVRHDFWVHKSDDRWEGAALDHPVAAESALRWLLAIELLERDGLLLHASSAVLEGEGHLFLGASGAGKSTIATEGGFDAVLCDEISIVAPGEDGQVMIWPSPFWGIGQLGEPTEPTPLGAIWELFGWEKTASREIPLADGVLATYRRVVDVGAAAAPPRRVLDIICDLAESLPVHQLSWQRGDPLDEVLALA